jgi:nitrous oxidase accessory protein NosD
VLRRFRPRVTYTNVMKDRIVKGRFLAIFALVVAVAVAGVIAFAGSPAHAANVGCGDTITTDTTLHKDLVNCPNDGILIGADHVTLDLNGHTIDGDGKPDKSCPVTELCDFGVAYEKHNGITVKHGSMRQFGSGLGAFSTRHTRLLGLATSRNFFSGIVFGTSPSTTAGNARILVRNCSGNRSTFNDGAGLNLLDTHHVRILNSSFRHNAHLGIVTAESSHDVIKGNVLSGNGEEAFLMEGGEGFHITHNRVVRNGGGITLGPGSHNVIKRNHVARALDGIRIEKGHGNLVAHNLVAHARHAGIRLGIKHPFLGGAHNSVRNNLVRDSRVDDFLVVRKARHSLLKGNVARGAGDDGFDIESPSIKLTSNLAARNGDLGIEAVRGVIDGGGNRARHNGDPRQCTNIVCK